MVYLVLNLKGFPSGYALFWVMYSGPSSFGHCLP